MRSSPGISRRSAVVDLITFAPQSGPGGTGDENDTSATGEASTLERSRSHRNPCAASLNPASSRGRVRGVSEDADQIVCHVPRHAEVDVGVSEVVEHQQPAAGELVAQRQDLDAAHVHRFGPAVADLLEPDA